MYTQAVPKLWTETIDAHRAQVRDAILDTTATLISEQGLLSVTMSLIAERTTIGRATLYKYFPDIETILLAWHERQVAEHLAQLAQLADERGTPMARLEAVLTAYAHIAHRPHGRHDAGITSFLHNEQQHVSHAEHALRHLVRDLIALAAAAGDVRVDVSPDELTSYCLHALNAAAASPSDAAVQRLVNLTVAGLRTN